MKYYVHTRNDIVYCAVYTMSVKFEARAEGECQVSNTSRIEGQVCSLPRIGNENSYESHSHFFFFIHMPVQSCSSHTLLHFSARSYPFIHSFLLSRKLLYFPTRFHTFSHASLHFPHAFILSYEFLYFPARPYPSLHSLYFPASSATVSHVSLLSRTVLSFATQFYPFPHASLHFQHAFMLPHGILYFFESFYPFLLSFEYFKCECYEDRIMNEAR